MRAPMAPCGNQCEPRGAFPSTAQGLACSREVSTSPWLKFGKINTDDIVDIGKLVFAANGIVGLGVLAIGVLAIWMLDRLRTPRAACRKAEIEVKLVQLGGYCRCPASALINLTYLLATDQLL